MRPPVYIAGPYRSVQPFGVDDNVSRARDLAAFAVRKGFTPFVPHVLGFRGVYGPGDTTALDCCLSMVHAFGDVEGAQMWVIARDDGSLSEGTALEVEAWDGAEPVVRTWSEWATEIGRVRS